MSRHEGVSCDSCLKGNFRGKRYKCLICYDYDLCATCYEAGTTTSRHTTEHPMQCILTRSDFDLYYGGEAVPVEQPQSFTCPFCGKMGFTETTLQEHVTAEHSDTSFEVICPVCAALPGGDPNNVTDDFAAHLTLEHRTPHDLISFINPVQDEPSGARHVRRIPHPGRGVGGTRARRTNMHFSSSSGLSALSPSNRESMDPISELLSQLSVVRRSATSAQSSTSSQLHQLQMQLRLERQQAQVARQQLERLPRRQAQTNSSTAATAAATSNTTVIGTGNTLASILDTSTNSALANNSQFLLSRFTEPPPSESEQQALETERADHSLFVQELLLSTLAEQSTPDESEDHDDFESKDSSLNSRDSEHIGNDRSRDSQPQGGAGTSGLGNLANSKTSPISNKKVQTTPPAPSMGAKATSRTSPSASREHQSYPQQMGVVTGVPGSGGAATRNQVGSGSVGSSRASPSLREQHPGGTTLNRSAARSASSASPASTRRKVYRHVEDRNKTEKEPPPH